MKCMLLAYFWPQPPGAISHESKSAMAADFAESHAFGPFLGDQHRARVHVWTRHQDNSTRGENRAYLRMHAKRFAARWTVLAFSAWFFAWLSDAYVWVQVALAVAGFVTSAVAMTYWYAHRWLNLIKRG